MLIFFFNIQLTNLMPQIFINFAAKISHTGQVPAVDDVNGNYSHFRSYLILLCSHRYRPHVIEGYNKKKNALIIIFRYLWKL